MDYVFKLEEMGVNLQVIHQRQELVVKHVVKTLIDVLSELSTQSYAVLTMDSVLKKIDEKYDFLKHIKIDSNRYSDGIDAVIISFDLESIRPTQIGKAIQKIIENITLSLGDEAGRDFIKKFGDHLGKTYLLRIEEMGVNLHMIQLKQDLLW